MNKKSLMTMCLVVAMVFAVSTAASATIVSWGTAGDGASVTVGASDVMLHTDDGGLGSAYVRLTIDGGIALDEITSLTYDAKLAAFTGSSCPILEVVFNIDADSDDVLEGTGLAWMTPATSHQPSALGNDNFLSGDFWPFAISTDGDYVTRDALGSDYFYWSADEERDGFGSYWTDFSTVLSVKLPEAGIDPTDKVYSIDFICGTSSNWQNADIYVRSVALNDISYVVPEPATIALLGLGGLFLRRRRHA